MAKKSKGKKGTKRSKGPIVEVSITGRMVGFSDVDEVIDVLSDALCRTYDFKKDSCKCEHVISVKGFKSYKEFDEYEEQLEANVLPEVVSKN
jgi:hypothetical protein